MKRRHTHTHTSTLTPLSKNWVAWGQVNVSSCRQVPVTELLTKIWAAVPIVRWFESNRAGKTTRPVPKTPLPFMPDLKELRERKNKKRKIFTMLTNWHKQTHSFLFLNCEQDRLAWRESVFLNYYTEIIKIIFCCWFSVAHFRFLTLMPCFTEMILLFETDNRCHSASRNCGRSNINTSLEEFLKDRRRSLPDLHDDRAVFSKLISGSWF